MIYKFGVIADQILDIRCMKLLLDFQELSHIGICQALVPTVVGSHVRESATFICLSDDVSGHDLGLVLMRKEHADNTY